ncbi:NmrA family protein [Elsinoe ampelina]|uniref:NmrA family protein n=1 Tax=Elsinoe ampelina TaxID=302913 RepID=A0A6A6FZT0_9PEZI|nr:NmrA family protein [Elsinoe ampelina]
MSKVILVTGATGKQGGSVVDALVSCERKEDFLILAVTRNADGEAARKLRDKGRNIRVVAGNLDDVAGLFDEAEKVAGQKVWGVYSVQVSMGKGVTFESEVKQGKDLVDESVKRGVQQFVYSSVDRGGDEESWNNPTPIDHFKSKQLIEHHLRDNAAKMGWTVLRPVAFMDNLEPGIPSRVFLTAMRDSLQGKPQQWIAVSDIGVFVALAFQQPEKFNHKALGLAGDELTFDELQAIFQRDSAAPPTPVFWFMGSFLKYMVTELGRMLTWFGTDGYRADIKSLKEMHPGLKDLETWLRKDSSFPIKAGSA